MHTACTVWTGVYIEVNRQYGCCTRIILTFLFLWHIVTFILFSTFMILRQEHPDHHHHLHLLLVSFHSPIWDNIPQVPHHTVKKMTLFFNFTSTSGVPPLRSGHISALCNSTMWSMSSIHARQMDQCKADSTCSINRWKERTPVIPKSASNV